MWDRLGFSLYCALWLVFIYLCNLLRMNKKSVGSNVYSLFWAVNILSLVCMGGWPRSGRLMQSSALSGRDTSVEVGLSIDWGVEGN